jgi:putative ATPase
MAINDAQALVKSTGTLPVPLPIRNAPTKLMKDIGHGAGYKYSHNYEGNAGAQEYMPDEVKGVKLYEPGNNPKEASFRSFLKDKWKEKYGY